MFCDRRLENCLTCLTDGLLRPSASCRPGHLLVDCTAEGDCRAVQLFVECTSVLVAGAWFAEARARAVAVQIAAVSGIGSVKGLTGCAVRHMAGGGRGDGRGAAGALD